MDWLQTELRYGALVLGIVCMALTAPSLLQSIRGSASPRVGRELGKFMVFGGVLWFQLGYVINGVPDVFHPWNAIALVAINAGFLVYIFASVLGRWEARWK